MHAAPPQINKQKDWRKQRGAILNRPKIDSSPPIQKLEERAGAQGGGEREENKEVVRPTDYKDYRHRSRIERNRKISFSNLFGTDIRRTGGRKTRRPEDLKRMRHGSPDGKASSCKGFGRSACFLFSMLLTNLVHLHVPLACL